MVLLDTDIMIDLLRKYPPAVHWLASLGQEEIVLPGFVVMELLQGCQNKAEQDQVEQSLSGSRTVWPTPEACNAAVVTFKQFRLRHGLGMIDALIAHMAVGLSMPLHTFNQKHYAVIATLTTVRPYQRTTP